MYRYVMCMNICIHVDTVFTQLTHRVKFFQNKGHDSFTCGMSNISTTLAHAYIYVGMCAYIYL